MGSPCGFENHDLTLCCAEPKRITTTSSTTTTKTSTTSTTTTTTTATTTTTTTTKTPSKCGISGVSTRIVNGNVRIVGGEYAPQGAWPWAVIIGRAGLTGFSIICGGSLIATDAVLTAAHCFDSLGHGGPTTVRLGEHDITTTSDGANHIDISIAKV